MIFGVAARISLRAALRCAVLAGALLATGVRAATEPPPDGLLAGPWVIMPSIGLSAALDSNPFYRSDIDPEAGPTDDQVVRLLPAVRAALPFRNSLFELSYDGSLAEYQRYKPPEKWTHVLGADLGLLFSTMDRVNARAEWTSGLSEVRIFDGGETVFDGVPFTYSEIAVGSAREVEGARGYRVSLERSALTYDQTQFTFFEFDGYELDAAFLEPRTSTRWLSASLIVRRFDHFLADTDSRELFRKEESEVVWGGIETGEGGPLQLRAKLGWGNWRFPGGEGRDYEGPVLDFVAAFVPRASTTAELRFERRVWPSFYGPNNYYLTTSAAAKVEQIASPGLLFAAEVNWTSLRYDEPFPDTLLRRDHAFTANVYATLKLAHRVALVWAITGAWRTSTEPSVEYRRTAVTLGMVWGWR